MHPYISIRGFVGLSICLSVSHTLSYITFIYFKSPPNHLPPFLGASLHLFKRVCWCVRLSDCLSITPYHKITFIHIKSPTNHLSPFLDASLHLCKRVCWSVRLSVSLSICLSVTPYHKITFIHLKSPKNLLLRFLDASLLL